MKDKLNIIYDEFRDLELNKEYYSERIKETRRKLKRIDIFLALFAGGSGVAGFGLWQYDLFGLQIGQIIFGVLAGIAIMVGIAKPYLRLEDELERLSAIQGTYDSISHIIKDIVIEIRSNKEVSGSSDTAFRALRQIRGNLGPKEDKPPNRELVDSTQQLINQRYPIGEFWYPEDDTPR